MATATSLQIGWRQLKLCVNAPYQLPPPPTGTQFVTIWTYALWTLARPSHRIFFMQILAVGGMIL